MEGKEPHTGNIDEDSELYSELYEGEDIDEKIAEIEIIVDKLRSKSKVKKSKNINRFKKYRRFNFGRNGQK